MIIHIASDEKFINSAYRQFKNIEGTSSRFYIIVKDIEKKLKHVDLQDNIYVISNNIASLKTLTKSISHAKLVCFHGLDYHSSVVLNRLLKKQKVLWFLFGKELYHNPYLYDLKDNIGKKTFNQFLRNNLRKNIELRLKNAFRSIKYLFKERTATPFQEITRAMKRADYCGVLYEEEFQLVKKKIKTDIKFIKFTYYPIEQMVENIHVNVTGNNILLGNSASYTNNHLEAFDNLQQLKLGLRSIITPLSYGNKIYSERISNYGNKILGANFVPLIDFMPLHQYNNYIQQCGIVVMNQYRQQAVGNVLVMLWMGAKIYLNKKNTLYAYLKRIGVHIYEITEDLTVENKDALELLTIEQQKHNRDCLSQEIAQDSLSEDLKTSIKSILCL